MAKDELAESKYIKNLKKEISKLKRENSQLRKKNTRLENIENNYPEEDEIEDETRYDRVYNNSKEGSQVCGHCQSDDTEVFAAGLFVFYKCRACGGKGKVAEQT